MLLKRLPHRCPHIEAGCVRSTLYSGTKRFKYIERKLRSHCKTCLLDSVRNTLYEVQGTYTR